MLKVHFKLSVKSSADIAQVQQYSIPHSLVNYYESYECSTVFSRHSYDVRERIRIYFFKTVFPLIKGGFSIAKPNLRAASSNIASDVISHMMTKLNQKPEQEGSGGLIVLSRHTRKRPPSKCLLSVIQKTKACKTKASVKHRSSQKKKKGSLLSNDIFNTFSFIMARLHQKSSECTLTELESFSAPLTQWSVKNKIIAEILPQRAD